MGMAGSLIGGIAGGVGSVFSAWSNLILSYQQSKQIRAQGKAQQQLAAYNAQVAEMQARTARQSGKYAEMAARTRAQQVKEKGRVVIASQRAAMAKAGVVGATGTPLLVAGESAQNLQVAALDQIWQGKMERRQYDIQARYQDAEARNYYYQGLLARKSANIQAKNVMLSGIASFIGGHLQGGSQVGSGVAQAGQNAGWWK